MSRRPRRDKQKKIFSSLHSSTHQIFHQPAELHQNLPLSKQLCLNDDCLILSFSHFSILSRSRVMITPWQLYRKAENFARIAPVARIFLIIIIIVCIVPPSKPPRDALNAPLNFLAPFVGSPRRNRVVSQSVPSDIFRHSVGAKHIARLAVDTVFGGDRVFFYFRARYLCVFVCGRDYFEDFFSASRVKSRRLLGSTKHSNDFYGNASSGAGTIYSHRIRVACEVPLRYRPARLLAWDQSVKNGYFLLDQSI